MTSVCSSQQEVAKWVVLNTFLKEVQYGTVVKSLNSGSEILGSVSGPATLYHRAYAVVCFTQEVS